MEKFIKTLHIVFVLIVISANAVRAQDDNFTPQLFKQFTEMRVGAGEPVYWYCVGEVYSFPEGKLLAKVEGIDTARMLKSESNATKVTQLSRKIFFYRDITTGAILREVGGQKVEPIAYPYQWIVYELKGDKMISTVTQGKAPRVQKIESTGTNRARHFNNLTIFSAPLFLNFGKYQAYENYDFLVQPNQSKNTPRYQLTWNRRGALPPFFGGGDSVFQLVSYRVDKYADLPLTMRNVLEKEARMWMSPPLDLKEIEELQK